MFLIIFKLYKVIHIELNMILLFLATLISLSIQHTPLSLTTSTQVTIIPPTSQIYELSVPPSIQTNQDLFITAIPTVDVPSQIPKISVQSKNTTYKCMQANNQLEGLCIISKKDLVLQLNQTLTINLTCSETCSFVLEAYLNDVIELDFAQKYTLVPKSDSTAIYQFQIEIPDQNWDEIDIQADFQLEKTTLDKGVQMYANVGGPGEPMPTQSNHKYKAVQIHRGIGISILRADVAPGSWIKIAVFSNKNIQISLSAHLALKSTYQLALHQRTYSFLVYGNQKQYLLDLSQSLSSLTDKDVYVTVLIYSGYPQIALSFDSSFQNLVENYGIAGSLSYLLTPTLRSNLNFSGMVYIKAVSFTEAYIQINSAINPKDFIFMEQSVTYLSFIQSHDIQNYVYDFNYELFSNESSSKILHFTAKIKVIEGMGYFASRICNSQSVSQCILANYSQMEDKQFKKQADDLPANILVYGSLYEVYMYTSVNKCRITQHTKTSDIYLCRIHMVGYDINSKEQLQWGITAYSRLKIIQLSQGKPFKDMVYEDAYNYYVFKVPPNIKEITIFVSTLSGESTLVASQIYTNPQLIFSLLSNSDIRTSANNAIKYLKGQLKEKVFIGVYGKSMAEYVVNVAVNRDSNRNTVISLIPKIQQFFHAEAETLIFGLSFNSEGEWVVQIVQLTGIIVTSLQDNESNIICKSFSRCLLNATRKDHMNMSVRSDKYAKFAINFYPRQQCRVFSVGVVNFVEVQPNITECVQYFINSQNLQISYSQNLLYSFSSKTSLNVSINSNQLGVMGSHYLPISNQELNIFCNNSNQSITKNCLLSIKISGDSQKKMELQISVIDLSTPIPLLDGVTLPFSHTNFKKQTGLYFYYYSLSSNAPTLFIRSLTYQSFFVAFKWIEYTVYANSTSYAQLFPQLLTKADFSSSFELDALHRLIQLKIPFNQGSKCEECLLLVSIYARDDYKESVFQLQVSSQEGSVQLGETVSITLNKDQFYSYELKRQDNNQRAMVQLENYRTQTSCYEALFTSDQTLDPISISTKEIILTNNQKKQYKLTVRSFKDDCKIGFLYWVPDFPTRIIYSGSRYLITLQNQQITYFLYYHDANTSFHMFMAAKSGYIKCKATPVGNRTLQSVMKQQEYLFGTDSIYEDIQISASDKNFCMECYYLIKATAVQSAKGVIGVVDQSSPAGMATDEVFREKVKKGVRYYEHYSHYQFKLKIGMVYGQVSLEVTDEWEDLVAFQVVKTDRYVVIKANSQKSSKLGRFLIKITSNDTATYSLQITDDRSIRLMQGFPLSHTFKGSDNNITFLYTHSNTAQFNLIIIDEESKTFGNFQIHITDGQRNISPVNIGKVGNILYYDIAGQKIDFHFTLKAQGSISIKLLITRNNLTFLSPSTASLAKSNTIYELYTNGSPVMLEIFSCKGSLQASASSKYSQINDSLSSSVIALQHSNIGGHYVIESRSNQREYFAWVKSKDSEPPQFLIFYSKIKNLPYGYFSTIERSITYRVNGNDLEMVFQVPALLNKQLKDISANFSFITVNNNTDFNALIQCGIGKGYLAIQKDLPPILDESQSFNFNISKKNLEVFLGKGVQTCFMGIVVQIRFKEDGQSRSLKYIYQTLQVALFFPQKAETNSSSTLLVLILWLVLPILFGIAIAGAAFYFCFKKYRMMVQSGTALVEESETGLPALNQKSQQLGDAPIEYSVQ